MVDKFVLDPAGIVELLKSLELAADMQRRVDLVAQRAQETAPVVTGGYRDSITSGTFDDGDRTTGYVQADISYACEVEVRHRTLGSSLPAAGGE